MKKEKSTHFFIAKLPFGYFCAILCYMMLFPLNISIRNINQRAADCGNYFETERRYIMKTKDELPECPVATTVSVIGSKWKLLIMRNLFMRPWRFNELKKDLEGISQKVLTDSLRSMEEDGIIIRTVYPEVPPRVEYALSELGESMHPILDAMSQWGTAYKNALSSH